MSETDPTRPAPAAHRRPGGRRHRAARSPPKPPRSWRPRTERWDLPIELEEKPWGADHYLETGETLPEGALEDLRDNYAAIFIGAYGDPRIPDMRHAADILLGIRFGLDLYVNYRPIRIYDERLCPLKGKTAADVDFVVFRENTEGAYVGVGGNFKKRHATTRSRSRRRFTPARGSSAFWSRPSSTPGAPASTKVCMADKSNVMRYGHDLWQRCYAEVGGALSRRSRPRTSTSTPWRCR